MTTGDGYQARAVLWSFLTMMRKSKKKLERSRGKKTHLIDSSFIPIVIGMNCITPSQHWYENACRERYQELQRLEVCVDKRELERCINRVKYTFSVMRATHLVYEVGTKLIIFLPCVLFFQEVYADKWKEKFIKYLRNYVHPLYPQEDIQYLQLNEEELNFILNKAHKLVEELSELKALIANLVEHYKAMKQLYEHIDSIAIYDKLDRVFEEVKLEQTRSLDNLRFQIYLLISKQNSILRHVLEMLVSLLIIDTLRTRGYLSNKQTLFNLYHRAIRDFIKDERIEHITKQLLTMSSSFSRTLQLTEDLLKTRYTGNSKGIKNIRSIARKMLISFVISMSLISIESVIALLITLLRTSK